MGDDAADGSGATRVDWDALRPAVERVGSDAARERSGPSDATDADASSPDTVDLDTVSATDADPGLDPHDDPEDPDAVAEAVIKADEATRGPTEYHDPDSVERHDTNDIERHDTNDAEPAAAAREDADEWADLTPAVERVAPTPAIRRVATESEPATLEPAEPDVAAPATDAGTDTATETFGGTEESGGLFGEGPPGDAEQPLAEHVEEMVKRLGIVIAVACGVSLALFPLTGEVITFLWYSILPGADVAAPHVYHPLEYKLTQIKVASLGGLIVALPVFVYQTYRFMRPGLYPHERRYYLASIPTSLVLGVLGVTFAYFVVLPAIMSYFLYYSQDVVVIAFALGATFDLILILMGYLAVVFQIPLFVMLAIMMGLTTREWLEDRRLIFWGAFVAVAFFATPDPTGMAPVLVGATMIALFEGTLALLRWTGR